MSESNTKTPRTFQCRNLLWKNFEEMARELECSVDYLINDAMKQYARQRGYAPSPLSQTASRPAAQPPSQIEATPPPLPGSSPAATAPALAPPPPITRAVGLNAPNLNTPSATESHSSSGIAVPPPLPQAPPPPPLSSASQAGRPPAPPTVPLAASQLPPLPVVPPAAAVPPGAAAPLPPPPLPPAGQVAPPLQLSIQYEGETYPVTKERFIIGRGKQGSDLTIRDPNVSRQHAQIEFSGGTYYMVDMGSTNGVEFSGQRVQRRAIQHGDRFRICDHELLMILS